MDWFLYDNGFRHERVKEKVRKVKKEPLRLVLPYLGTLSLQTKTKLQKSIKRVLK